MADWALKLNYLSVHCAKVHSAVSFSAFWCAHSPNVCGFQVGLGLAFRVFDQLSTAMKWNTKVCYTVNRGEGYEPVQSCEGEHKVRELFCFSSY